MTYAEWIDYGREQGWVHSNERKESLCKLLGQVVRTTHGIGTLRQVWEHQAAVGIEGKLAHMPLDAVLGAA